MDAKSYLEGLRDLLKELEDYGQHRSYTEHLPIQIRISEVKEKILDAEYMIYTKKQEQDRIAILEKQITNLQQMLEYLPGSGPSFLKAKESFETTQNEQRKT